MQRRQVLLAATAGTVALALPARAAHPLASRPWREIEAAARGQTVHFNAWGGSERVNAYLQWAAGELERAFGITLTHVKLADTAEMVRRVRAEKAAGRTEGGSADLVWINGENFLAMKREGLLFGPFAEQLPSFRFVDVEGKPTTRIDFAEPVDGMEAAWGMAQLSFFVDTARAGVPAPATLDGLLAWAAAHPGRFSYPRPPQFIGTTFLKQVMLTLAPDRGVFAQPLTPEAFARATPALWAWLDKLHPHLWRQGRQFPANPGTMRQMLADGELTMSLSFNPNEPANLIRKRTLPASVVTFQLAGGTIGNTHFLAIPFNARAREAAMVAANFFQSPLAQARKADISVWGDATVLAPARLDAAQRSLFQGADPVPGQLRDPQPVWPEPHGSWVEPLEAEWLRRYGS